MIVARIDKMKRLYRIRLKQVVQSFPTLSIAIAVDAVKVTTVDMNFFNSYRFMLSLSRFLCIFALWIKKILRFRIKHFFMTKPLPVILLNFSGVYDYESFASI